MSCHDPQIIEPFSDGILWATLGRTRNIKQHVRMGCLTATEPLNAIGSGAEQFDRDRSAPELLGFAPVVVFLETALTRAVLFFLVRDGGHRRASRTALVETSGTIRSLIHRRAS